MITWIRLKLAHMLMRHCQRLERAEGRVWLYWWRYGKAFSLAHWVYPYKPGDENLMPARGANGKPSCGYNSFEVWLWWDSIENPDPWMDAMLTAEEWAAIERAESGIELEDF